MQGGCNQLLAKTSPRQQDFVRERDGQARCSGASSPRGTPIREKWRKIPCKVAGFQYSPPNLVCFNIKDNQTYNIFHPYNILPWFTSKSRTRRRLMPLRLTVDDLWSSTIRPQGISIRASLDDLENFLEMSAACAHGDATNIYRYLFLKQTTFLEGAINIGLLKHNWAHLNIKMAQARI